MLQTRALYVVWRQGETYIGLYQVGNYTLLLFYKYK